MKKILIGIVSLLILTSVIGLVMAVDTKSTTASVTVPQFLSVTLTSGSPVTFGSMNPGTENSKPSNDPLIATIGAESNVGASVGTKADDPNFASGTNTFAVSNLEWSATSTFPGTDYTETNAPVCASVAAGIGCSIYHELDIPNEQTAGTYTVGITITATGV